VIGQFAQAIVKQEIENNRFTIKTNRPLVKVLWQVTGAGFTTSELDGYGASQSFARSPPP
jgi:hypothetical protein